MNLSFPASNTPGGYPLGQIGYNGIYCNGYPNCTPNMVTGWFAEVPGTENGPQIGPARYQLTLNVIDGPCVPYAQFFINSATKHKVDPLLMAAIAAHESGNYDAVFGSNPNSGAGPAGGKGLMQVDTTTGPTFVQGKPDSTTLDPAWNIEAGTKIYTDGQPGCTTTNQRIVAYNAGHRCASTNGTFPACTDDQGTKHHYLDCVDHHLNLLRNAGYNFDCAGPAQSPPTLIDRRRLGVTANSVNDFESTVSQEVVALENMLKGWL